MAQRMALFCFVFGISPGSAMFMTLKWTHVRVFQMDFDTRNGRRFPRHHVDLRKETSSYMYWTGTWMLVSNKAQLPNGGYRWDPYPIAVRVV